MALMWTRKADGHQEDSKTVSLLDEIEGKGNIVFPDPNASVGEGGSPLGYVQRKFDGPTRRYVQTLTLQSDEEAVRAYRRWHSREHVWKEILEGIRQVGILEMEIYIHGNTLVMICEAPASLDWNSAMAQLATLPRQAEWEAFVSQFQGCSAQATSNEKWQMMERMFHLYE